MATPDGIQTSVFKGELEIDHQRGVIYFHSAGGGGGTILRIGGLPKPVPEPKQRMLDILITNRENTDAERDPDNKEGKMRQVVCDWKGH